MTSILARHLQRQEDKANGTFIDEHALRAEADKAIFEHQVRERTRRLMETYTNLNASATENLVRAAMSTGEPLENVIAHAIFQQRDFQLSPEFEEEFRRLQGKG